MISDDPSHHLERKAILYVKIRPPSGAQPRGGALQYAMRPADSAVH
jgi:hypothetical protein